MAVNILGRQQDFACNDIQMTRMTAQVASFELPPGFLPGQTQTGIGHLFAHISHMSL